MNKGSKIYVAGHRGLVGSAILRRLAAEGYKNVVTRTHRELDLTDQRSVCDFFAQEQPEYVFLAAAKVGGIYANNTYPAEFIYENLVIQTNIIHESWKSNVKRLLFLGSSCIYPRDCPQPMKEEFLLTGPLESTNRPYAVAKIAGIELCWAYNRQYGTDYLAVMPTNLYGLNDNYDLLGSHVIPALIRKTHEAKRDGLREITVWGTGRPMREFLYSDDLADACLFLMQRDDRIFKSITAQDKVPLLNVGYGEETSIGDLAHLIVDVVGFGGDLRFDTSKPDGTPRKLLDSTTIRRLGWQPTAGLREGLVQTYRDYINRHP